MSDHSYIDVLSIGHASYDLIFSVTQHPAADEKMVADNLFGCGGGPAANAAVQTARLGFSSAFCGYLGFDPYGDSHAKELLEEGVDSRWLVRGDTPTPLSVVLVKPDGKRALINHKGMTKALPHGSVDFADVTPKVVLFDGHEPQLALDFLAQKGNLTPSVLDGGSLHEGTRALLDKVDYLVCSEKFALQFSSNVDSALSKLSALASAAVVTLGERGLIWRRGAECGKLPAPSVNAIDTTGAGDAFHGAFAAGLSAGLEWSQLLRYASVAGAYCCTRMGARPGLPDHNQHQALLRQWQAGLV